MKSMPLRPPANCPCDGAFPSPAQDLAGPEEQDMAAVDSQIGRKLLLVGGGFALAGSLIGMTVKPTGGQSGMRKMAKLGAMFGTIAVTWAMVDTQGRDELLREIQSMTDQQATDAQAANTLQGEVMGLGSDVDLKTLSADEARLDKLKTERLRQAMILRGIGLGPLAEPIHVNKAMAKLDPSIAEGIQTQHDTKLAVQKIQSLNAKTTAWSGGLPPVTDTGPDPTAGLKKYALIGTAVAGAAILGTVLMKG